MAHHVIDISAPSCSITCRHGQLVCRAGDGPERSLPMEDVGALLINSFSATVHNRVVIEAAQHGTVLIFCERFKPAGLLLPANRATDTVLTRAQLRLTPVQARAYWHRTVTAKCANQTALARCMDPEGRRTDRLARVARGLRPDKESACARLYWAVLSTGLELARFKRARDGGGLNSLLNYGYAVLLARVLQRMLAVGIDPTFGIGHVVRERATPLAYDLMEPFRVAVDAQIAAWVRQQPQAAAPGALEVTPEYKKWLLGFLERKVPYRRATLAVERAIEESLRSFREALVSKRPDLYRPWTLENTKWDGFW